MAFGTVGRPIDDNTGEDGVSAAYRRFAVWAVLANVRRLLELVQHRVEVDGWKEEAKEIRDFLTSDLCEFYVGFKFTRKEVNHVAWQKPIDLWMFEDGIFDADDVLDRP